MARFQYQARLANGEQQNGFIDAKSDLEAKIKLRAKQLTPLSVKLAQDDKSLKVSTQNALLSFFEPKANHKDFLLFTRQFATLINAGIPIVDALKILIDSTLDRVIKDALIQIKASVEVGRKLSESMAQHPRVFDSLYCNMIKAGEEAGILDIILNRLCLYIEKNQKIKNQVKSALVMPGFIIVAATVIIMGIITIVIPKFQELYKSSNKELPAITQALVDVSLALRTNFSMYALVAAVIIYVIYSYTQSEDGKKAFDSFVINAPLIGVVIQKSGVARLTRTLSTLLSSGISLLEAIDIASRTAGNSVLELALMNCKESISSGKPFHLPLSRQKEIPQMVAQMVAIGEQTGALDTMLSKVADFYEDEVENSVRALTSMIEPTLLIVVGSIIALILVAMYMPIFQIGDVVG